MTVLINSTVRSTAFTTKDIVVSGSDDRTVKVIITSVKFFLYINFLEYFTRKYYYSAYLMVSIGTTSPERSWSVYKHHTFCEA